MAELTKEECEALPAARLPAGQVLDLLDTILALRARAETAEHALREAGMSLDSDARTIDDLRAQSESWRRGHGAWQTWAEEMLRARGMQPEGGLLGDGPARDALRARLETAERERDVALDMYSDAVKACTGVVPRVGPDAARGGILAPRPLAEMVRGLAAERDSWRSQAAVEATCLGRVSERADEAEARVRELETRREPRWPSEQRRSPRGRRQPRSMPSAQRVEQPKGGGK